MGKCCGKTCFFQKISRPNFFVRTEMKCSVEELYNSNNNDELFSLGKIEVGKILDGNFVQDVFRI